MGYLTAELDRAVFSRGFLAAAAGTAGVLCIGAFDCFKQLAVMKAALPAGTHEAALLAALMSDVMLLALPVLAALPGAAGFAEDWKSGYVKFALPRAGRGRYVAAKAAAAAAAGALAVALGIAAVFALMLLVFLPAEARPLPEAQTAAMELLGKAALFSLCGGLWGLVGLMCSVPTLSTYIAYASPFILYYVLVILVARYFPDAAILSPQEWLKPTRDWPGGSWGIALLVTELAGAAALAFGMAALRRLRDE